MLLPVPISELPRYHLQRAPLPRLPPFTVRVTLVDPQVESALALMPVATTLGVFTLMDLLAHAVVLQVPTALTK